MVSPAFPVDKTDGGGGVSSGRARYVQYPAEPAPSDDSPSCGYHSPSQATTAGHHSYQSLRSDWGVCGGDQPRPERHQLQPLGQSDSGV